MVARGSGFKFGRGTEHSDGMMQFDGEARFRADRAKRNLGALAREGFQPARRHPSAARSRYHQRAYTDDELDDEPCGETSSFAYAYAYFELSGLRAFWTSRIRAGSLKFQCQ